jgi:hypothetical protein
VGIAVVGLVVLAGAELAETFVEVGFVVVGLVAITDVEPAGTLAARFVVAELAVCVFVGM